MFAERGYEGARVEQIADAADVSPGLLYRHFEGKQELYTEILQLANRELMAHLTQAAAPDLPDRRAGAPRASTRSSPSSRTTASCGRC